jgi:hypothetical protein
MRDKARTPAVRGGRALKLRMTGNRTDQVDLALPRSPARAVETTRPAKVCQLLLGDGLDMRGTEQEMGNVVLTVSGGRGP